MQLHELRLFILLSKYLTLLDDQHFSAALLDSDMLDQLNDETQSGHMSMIHPIQDLTCPFLVKFGLARLIPIVGLCCDRKNWPVFAQMADWSMDFSGG